MYSFLYVALKETEYMDIYIHIYGMTCLQNSQPRLESSHSFTQGWNFFFDWMRDVAARGKSIFLQCFDQVMP